MSDSGTSFGSPKRILLGRGLRPRKRFGQNFLVDPRLAERIGLALPADAFVVEIGAGTGTLTAALQRRARCTVALEVDTDLVALLNERFPHREAGLRIVATDALAFDFQAALARQPPPRAVCGNLPYYITSPLLERVIGESDLWECAVLMVQREYARRLCARPASPEYGSLTLFVNQHCTVEKLFDVGAAGLYPAPTVASTVVRLQPRHDRQTGLRNEQLLFSLVRAGFNQRRKTLANSISAHAALPLAHARSIVESALRGLALAPNIRAEELSLDDFRRLANALDEARFLMKR